MTFFANKSRIPATFGFRTIRGNGSGVPINGGYVDQFPGYGSNYTINITYTWGSSEADLDTRTYIVAPISGPWTGIVLGWSYASSIPSGIATWSGDDTGYGGTETVNIYLDNIVTQSGWESVLNPYIDIHLGAYFFGRYVDPDGNEGPLPPEPRDPSNSATFNYQITTWNDTFSGSQVAFHQEFVGVGINEFRTFRIDLLDGNISG